VRAGLGAYTDKAGHVWAADTGFTGGNADHSTAAITGTTDPALYQGERWGNFSYRYTLPNGTYSVTLKFAEIYWTQKGQRVFNVALNGQAALTNFDILAQVAPHTALDRSFTVTVTGGSLTAAFTASTDAATLQAIEIVPVPGANVVPEKRAGEAVADTRQQVALYRHVPGRAVEIPGGWRASFENDTAGARLAVLLVHSSRYDDGSRAFVERWWDRDDAILLC